MATLGFLPLGLPATDKFWTNPPAAWTAKKHGQESLSQRLSCRILIFLKPL